jgi:hypothetical protein
MIGATVPGATMNGSRRNTREQLQALEEATERLDRELNSTGANNSERIAALTAVVNGRAAVVNASVGHRAGRR